MYVSTADRTKPYVLITSTCFVCIALELHLAILVQIKKGYIATQASRIGSSSVGATSTRK